MREACEHRPYLIKGPFGPHYGKSICYDCGVFIKWEKRPMQCPKCQHEFTPVAKPAQAFDDGHVYEINPEHPDWKPQRKITEAEVKDLSRIAALPDAMFEGEHKNTAKDFLKKGQRGWGITRGQSSLLYVLIKKYGAAASDQPLASEIPEGSDVPF